MAEGSFVGAKIVGALIAIVGILLLVVGATAYIPIPITLPVEIIAALTAISGSSLMLILYGLICLGVSVGLFQAKEWAAGAAAVLLIIVLVATGAGLAGLIMAFGIDVIIALILGLSISLIIQIGVFVVALVSLIYLVAASGWR